MNTQFGIGYEMCNKKKRNKTHLDNKTGKVNVCKYVEILNKCNTKEKKKQNYNHNITSHSRFFILF